MKILFDGLNFELARGTGIKTYSRSMAVGLTAIGHHLDLLSDKSMRRVPLVSSSAAYLASLQAAPDKRLRLKHRLSQAAFGLGRRVNDNITLDSPALIADVTGNEQWRDIERVLVRPSLFTKAFARVSLGLGMTPIGKAKDVDALLLTSPIPVYLPSRLNVLSVHDLIPMTHPQLIDRWEVVSRAFALTLKNGLERADKVICISHTTASEVLKHFSVDPKKLHIAYQPCRYADEAELSDESRQAFIRSLGFDEEPFVLYAGAVEPKKNLMNVLKAVQRNAKLPKLVVAGPLAWSSAKERALMAQLKHRVTHLGYVQDDELKALQQSAAACVFVSLVEGFGLPALEAIWQGTPCVLSDIPIFREMFADNPYFVNPYRPDEIGEAIWQAVNAPRSASQAQARLVRERHGRAQFAEQLAPVFK